MPGRVREFDLARRVRPSRPASVRSISRLVLNMVHTHGIHPTSRDGVHIASTAIESVPSLSGSAIAYRWRSVPLTESLPRPCFVTLYCQTPCGTVINFCLICHIHLSDIFVLFVRRFVRVQEGPIFFVGASTLYPRRFDVEILNNL